MLGLSCPSGAVLYGTLESVFLEEYGEWNGCAPSLGGVREGHGGRAVCVVGQDQLLEAPKARLVGQQPQPQQVAQVSLVARVLQGLEQNLQRNTTQ